MTVPRLSRAAGFWAVAFAFLALTAFATAPSPLYGLFKQQDHLGSLALTIVYAVYAIGVVASLVLAGHLSDVYGRRAVLIPSLLVAAAASVVFLASTSLPSLLVARLLTGVALGAGVATATAYITDLDAADDGVPSARSGIVATVANVGGLALGPLVAGALAQWVPDGPTLTFVVLLVALLVAVGIVARSPEGHEAVRPRRAYRPQQLRAPAHARGQFIAATTAAFLTFAVAGLLAGLAGTLLAGPLHHPSAILTGVAIFVNFGAGVVTQATTTRVPAHRLVAAGLVPLLLGLIVLVVSTWTSPPSLALFLIGGAIAGVGNGAIIRGSLTVVISTASAADRAGALATYFTAGYVGISLPVLGAGIALQYVSPRVTLLIFAAAVGAGILAAAPRLIRRPGRAQPRGLHGATSPPSAPTRDSAGRDDRAAMRPSLQILTPQARSTAMQLFLIRGLVAIAWAVVFAATTSGSPTTGISTGAAVLVVLYPLIDVVASVIDAHGQHGPARRLLLGDAATSAAAAVALGIAATGSVANVVAVFGVWAAVSGAAQLVTALRRRAQYGKQWPMLLAGGVSVIFGVAFLIASAGTDPRLNMVAIYAAAGGIDFVIQAGLLARRRHHPAAVPA